MRELELIENYYRDKRANRSGVLLINHIHEGLLVLEALDAPDIAKRAFCIHPIVQNAVENIDLTWSDALPLAHEYSQKANSYLCRVENDWIKNSSDLFRIVGKMSEDCRLMLLADKLQNRKDFVLYHKGSHERTLELTKYFDLWIEFLRNKVEVVK